MKSITIKSLLAAALLLPFAASAAPITGDIGMGGALLPSCGGVSGGGCTMDIADGLDFTPNSALISFATGDFATAGIVFGDLATINDFGFDPFATVNPLWTIAGFSFALESLTIVDQTSTVLELRGSGTISADGFDDTLGFWSLSTDAASPNITFSWSSTTVAPEPGILILMGMGLIGGLAARRLKR